MTPTQEIIDLLRDEAYLSLCRETLQEALDRLEERKRETVDTRPPFGILASRKTRDTFSRAMTEIETNEASLQTRMTRVGVIQEHIESQLRTALDEFLCTCSPDHRRKVDVIRAIDAWENLLPQYFEQLWAFARDLGAVARAIESSIGNASGGVEGRVLALAELRIAAQRMDRSVLALETAARKTATIAGAFYQELRLESPPIQHVEAWTDSIAMLSSQDLLPRLRAMETNARALITGDVHRLKGCATTAREITQAVANRYRDEYWQQLRDHAQQHFVEERDLDEVLQELTDRYIVGHLRRQQEAVEYARDPYRFER